MPPSTTSVPMQVILAIALTVTVVKEHGSQPVGVLVMDECKVSLPLNLPVHPLLTSSPSQLSDAARFQPVQTAKRAKRGI